MLLSFFSLTIKKCSQQRREGRSAAAAMNGDSDDDDADVVSAHICFSQQNF